jgi:hypothetical protein
MSDGVSPGSFFPPLSHGAPLLPEGEVCANLDVLGGGATTAAILEDNLATHGGLLVPIIVIIVGGI